MIPDNSMATIKEEETIIKREPNMDPTDADTSGAVIRKDRTLPAFFMTSGIKSEMTCAVTSTSSISKRIKTEEFPIDIEDCKISTTHSLVAEENPIITQTYDIKCKPDPEDGQQLKTEPTGNSIDGEVSVQESEASNADDQASEVIIAQPKIDDGSSTMNERSQTPDSIQDVINASVPTSTVNNSPSSSCIADGDNAASTSNTKNRLACMYGASCYRVNPQHRAKFSHPEDPDFRCDSTSNKNVTKPDCRYGSQCYRKNKEHRQKFNHPTSTGRPKRKRTLRVELQIDSDNDSESLEDFSDSDEYESSFVEDSSDDDLSVDLEGSENEESDLSGGSNTSEDENEKKKKKKGKTFKKKKFSLF